MYDASWHFTNTIVCELTPVGRGDRRKGVCTTFSSVGVLVCGGIGAVKVYILVSHEATVSVLRLDIVRCDCVPCVTHPLLDVRFRERAGSEYTLPPEVEERVVEGREALR